MSSNENSPRPTGETSKDGELGESPVSGDVTMTLEYDRDLRVLATHGPSGTTVATDAPADNGGQARTFSPTDLLAVSLASCILTSMALAARRDGYELDSTGGVTAEVRKRMSTTGPRRIERLLVSIALPGVLTPQQREKLQQAVTSCPVSRSLHPETRVDLTFVTRFA